MYRKLLSLSQQGSIPWSVDFIHSIRNNYPSLYDYYMRWKWDIPQGQSPGNPQHEAMAQHYRAIIIQALREFDSSQTDEIYEALSWIGLMGSGTIDTDTGLTTNPTIAWSNLTQNERLNIIEINNTFNAVNLNCE